MLEGSQRLSESPRHQGPREGRDPFQSYSRLESVNLREWILKLSICLLCFCLMYQHRLSVLTFTRFLGQ